MHKTTLYLPEMAVHELKSLSLGSSKKGLTYHIQQAVKMYLAFLKKNKKSKLSVFLKGKGVGKKSQFGDGVVFQRRLRDEWN